MEQAFNSMFGGGKKKMPKKGGHVLGGGDETKPVAPPPRVLDITFCSESLGMHLSDADGVTTVKQIENNSEASRAGVRVGFKIVKLQGKPVESYDTLIAQIQSCGRPCLVTFEDSMTAIAPQKKKQVSAEQGDSAGRREASAKAAETRTAAWDKKMSNTRVVKAQSAKLENQKKSLDRKGESGEEIVSAESAAAFEVAKRKEAEETARLGYNPYQPIFGSASQGRAAVEAVAAGDIAPTMGPSSPTGPSNNPQSGAPVRAPQARAQSNPTPSSASPQIEHEPSEALSMALALLSSHPDEVSGAAVSTCLKLMTNLVKGFPEAKFHTVRMGNKAFNKKVATVSGGIELMNAAGFVFVSDEATDEMLLVYPMLDQPDGDLLCAIQHLQRIAP